MCSANERSAPEDRPVRKPPDLPLALILSQIPSENIPANHSYNCQQREGQDCLPADLASGPTRQVKGRWTMNGIYNVILFLFLNLIEAL